MAKSVLELAVGTGKWDAGLKKAKQSLDNFTQANGGLQQALDKESQKMGQFVQMMGKMDSTAKTAKGQMNDYKSTIEQLTMQYNRMTEAQKQSIGQDYLNAIEQIKQKYHAVNEELQDMNRSLNGSTSSGGSGGVGLFGGDKLNGMLQVFGGNVMTKAASMAANFAVELGDAVKQGIELARQGEGIRIAFDRLGRGDILDGLREATHGTVTDLELMKAAVKFNDFKLPLEELGTMLAFAQQKAKDTGQSVDYMVDSIVTGLGRKSLMILDNLGLSAAEIKEKMKENGDMTKAVGAIIREQMAKAGEYIETAADRAQQADVRLKNSMEDLGRTLSPLTDAGQGLFNTWKVAAIDLLNSAIKPLLQAFTQLGAIQKIQDNVNGGGFLGRITNNLINSKNKDSLYSRQLEEINRTVNKARANLQEAEKGGMGSIEIYRNRLKAVENIRDQYIAAAKQIMSPVTPDTPSPGAGGAGGGGGKGGGSTQNVIDYASDSIAAQQAIVSELTKEWQNAGADVRDGYLAQLVAAENALKRMNTEAAMMRENLAGKLKGGEVQTNLGTLTDYRSIKFKGLNINSSETQKGVDDLTKSLKEQQKAFGLASQAATSFGAALAGIEDPGVKAAGMVMQAVAGIALGFATASANANTAGTGWGWLAWLAAGASAMATTIATIHSLTGYAEGGIVKGNSYSGDNLYGPGFGINAGELVLNTAQQNNVAQALEGGGLKNLKLEGVLKGENIWIAANRYTKRTGQGEIVTW